jgi:hypothetical protein
MFKRTDVDSFYYSFLFELLVQQVEEDPSDFQLLNPYLEGYGLWSGIRQS